MALASRFPPTNVYRVEVSGWDIAKDFFVEKTELEWDENDAKRVRLSRSLRKGSMIFVRLLQPTEASPSFPIAYEVDPVGPADNCREFRLRQVYPRVHEQSMLSS